MAANEQHTRGFLCRVLSLRGKRHLLLTGILVCCIVVVVFYKSRTPSRNVIKPMTREQMVANLLGVDSRRNLGDINDPKKLHEILGMPVTTPKQPRGRGSSLRTTVGYYISKPPLKFEEAARRHEDTKQRAHALIGQGISGVNVGESAVGPVGHQVGGPTVQHPSAADSNTTGGSSSGNGTTARQSSTRKPTPGLKRKVARKRPSTTAAPVPTLVPEQQNGDGPMLNLWKQVSPTNPSPQNNHVSNINTMAQGGVTLKDVVSKGSQQQLLQQEQQLQEQAQALVQQSKFSQPHLEQQQQQQQNQALVQQHQIQMNRQEQQQVQQPQHGKVQQHEQHQYSGTMEQGMAQQVQQPHHSEVQQHEQHQYSGTMEQGMVQQLLPVQQNIINQQQQEQQQQQQQQQEKRQQVSQLVAQGQQQQRQQMAQLQAQGQPNILSHQQYMQGDEQQQPQQRPQKEHHLLQHQQQEPTQQVYQLVAQGQQQQEQQQQEQRQHMSQLQAQGQQMQQVPQYQKARRYRQ